MSEVKTRQQLLVEQLESSVEFLANEMRKRTKGSKEYAQLVKELAQARVQLVRERNK